MDLSLKGIYLSALRGIKSNPLIYLLLLIWGLVQGVILFILTMVGAPFWLGAIFSLEAGPETTSSIFNLTLIYIGVIIFAMSLLSAATRAGVLAFGAEIRKGKSGTILDFLTGIFKYTWPLFIGGIVVGMLTWIPILVFLNIVALTFAGIDPDIFTSGWNIGKATTLIGLMVNAAVIAGIFQTLIFFWIAPWDEMVVLYRKSFPDALLESFRFVFSRRHFLRVLSLVVANVCISQILMILLNLNAFREGLHFGFTPAYISVLANSLSSTSSSFAQFILFPFFAFSQLFLLPAPKTDSEADSDIEPSPDESTEVMTAI